MSYVVIPLGELIEAGMFYFTRLDLLKLNSFQDENCDVVEIETKDSLEIDTQYDLEIARLLMKIRK
jgi:N-acylneuraminate/3-deoxy-D-glycero-D-galacto-nononate cytidylyltransferase